MKRNRHAGRNNRRRPVEPGFERKGEYRYEATATSVEQLLRDSFEQVLALVLKELDRQGITGDARPLRAFADCLMVDTGHQLNIVIEGKLPELPEIVRNFG